MHIYLPHTHTGHVGRHRFTQTYLFSTLSVYNRSNILFNHFLHNSSTKKDTRIYIYKQRKISFTLYDFSFLPLSVFPANCNLFSIPNCRRFIFVMQKTSLPSQWFLPPSWKSVVFGWVRDGSLHFVPRRFASPPESTRTVHIPPFALLLT